MRCLQYINEGFSFGRPKWFKSHWGVLFCYTSNISAGIEIPKEGQAASRNHHQKRTYSHSRVSEPKTSSSHRTVPIPHSTLERLRAYRDWWKERLGEEPPPTMWVFPGNDPTKPLDYNAPGHALHRIVKSLGIPPLRVHDLRHSYGSHLLANGAPLELIAERMGHANANITLSIYRHVLEHERQGWLVDVEDLLSRPRAKV